MNLIPHYIVILKIIRRLSRIRNNIYRVLPFQMFFKLKTRKWVRNYNKNTVKNILNDSLGDFSEYAEFATEKDTIISTANDALNHTFDLLGSGPVKLDPIDWHIDFKSGFRWPKGRFYKDYVLIDLKNNADVKVPWELSRSHHFLWLGQAYLLTKDEKYTETFVKQISWWIDDNPVMRSINWTCAMEVSIRAVNWLYALNMFIDSELITSKLTRRVTKSLYEHAFFVFNNLEKMFPYSGNHYAANIVGLIYLGLFFNKRTLGKKWFSFALKEYFREVRVQVLPSGVHFEKSISYQRLVTELFFYTQLFLENNDIYIPLDIRARIERMLDFILCYTKPDGTAPMIGDDDDGRFLPFIKQPFNFHQYLLCLATIRYKNPAYKLQSSMCFDDGLFFYGERGKLNFDRVIMVKNTLSTKMFSDAGFCIMRHKNFYAFINNSGATKYPDHSSTGGSHTHADLLSFELAVGNTTFLVDPGAYVYSASKNERNKFRSSQMHNTLVVDGQNQHVLPENNIFEVEEIAYPIEYGISECESEITFQGSHNGYQRLSDPIIHQRLFCLRKKDTHLTITDNVLGNGTHLLQWFFHFNAGIGIRFLSHDSVEATSLTNGQTLLLKFNAPFHIRLEIIDDFVSPSYGVKHASKTLVLSAQTECPAKLATSIISVQ